MGEHKFMWTGGSEEDLPAPGKANRIYFANNGQIFRDLVDTWDRTNLVHLGLYDPDFAYSKLDIVTYDGSAWKALRGSVGVTPVEGPDWTIFAAAAVGPAGPTGPTGSTGPTGPTGSTGPMGPAGPGSSPNIERNDVLVVSGATTLDYSAAFNVSEGPTQEANISPNFGTTSETFAEGSALQAHIDDTTDAHDATAISYAGGPNMSATDVEGAIDELDSLLRISRTEVSITGATTLTSSAFGKSHVCSGTSADYTVTLPAASGNAGKTINFRMSLALTKYVTLDGNGSEAIDGLQTRVMWAQETALLLCDGTGWTKLTGRIRPMLAHLRNGTAVSIPSGGATTKVTLQTTLQDVGGMADLTNSRIIARRSGDYMIQGRVTLEANATLILFSCVVTVNGGVFLQTEERSGETAHIPTALGSYGRFTSAGDVFELKAENYSGSSRNTYASFTPLQSTLYVEEKPTW